MEYFIKLIKKKYKVDISKDARARQKLRREAERAKRALSSQHQVCFIVALGPGGMVLGMTWGL
jgi:molecular chaperone DnaK (HSP70)